MKAKCWCVESHGDQWCAAKFGRPDDDAAGVETMCGYFVILPLGTAWRVPNCRGCGERMMKIPEDVMELAGEICSQIAEFGAPAQKTVARAILAERERCAKIVETGCRVTASQLDAYIQMALHDIDELRGPQRESVQVFREFYRAIQKRMRRQEVDWGPDVGQEAVVWRG